MSTGFKYTDKVGENNQLNAILAWKEDENNIIDGDLFITSNIFPISKFNASVFITEANDPEFKLKILYETSPSNIQEELKFHVQKKGLRFEGDLVTPFSDFSSVRFNGLLNDTGNGNYKAIGKVYKNFQLHTFDGDVILEKNMPKKAELTILNSRNSDKIQLTYQLEFVDLTRRIKGKVASHDEFISFESELYIQKLIDWAYNVKVESSNPQFDEVKLSTSLTPNTKTQLEASFEMITPWEALMINKVNVSSIITLSSTDGNFQLAYEISKVKGSGKCEWKWIQRVSNQNYILKISNENEKRKFSSEISFKNSSKIPTELVFDVDVNSLWALSSKATFDVRNIRDMYLKYDLKLPSPVDNTHKFTANYKGKEFPPRIEFDSFADLNINYENDQVVGNLKSTNAFVSKIDITKKFDVEWGDKSAPKKIDSIFTVKRIEEKSEYRWLLETPLYSGEKSVDFQITSSTQDPYKILHTIVRCPESKKIAMGDVAFEDLSNMKGNVNSTLPIFNITWFAVVFDFESKNGETSKFINATWPDNEATFISENTLVDEGDRKKLKGTLKAELPLQTKHSVDIVYEIEVSRGAVS